MLSIFTLNIWRYYDFDIRLPNILTVLHEKDPDVILFQEVQIDPSQSPFSQVEIIKKTLVKYPYSVHSTIYQKTSQRGKKLEKPVQHGMAILSKYPITNTFEYFVTQNTGEVEPRSILCFDIAKNDQTFLLANIHFANNEEWAHNQLDEFLAFLRSRNEQRILAGDFNLFHLPEYSDYKKDYLLSYDYHPYISYPKDNGCLDYIMIPKTFHFTQLEEIERNLSDHKGLFAVIDKTV